MLALFFLGGVAPSRSFCRHLLAQQGLALQVREPLQPLVVLLREQRRRALEHLAAQPREPGLPSMASCPEAPVRDPPRAGAHGIARRSMVERALESALMSRSAAAQASATACKSLLASRRISEPPWRATLDRVFPALLEPLLYLAHLEVGPDRRIQGIFVLAASQALPSSRAHPRALDDLHAGAQGVEGLSLPLKESVQPFELAPRLRDVREAVFPEHRERVEHVLGSSHGLRAPRALIVSSIVAGRRSERAGSATLPA